MEKRFVAAVASVALTALCGAGTITVDDDGAADFDDIQSAVNHARDGDLIMLQQESTRQTRLVTSSTCRARESRFVPRQVPKQPSSMAKTCGVGSPASTARRLRR